MTIQKLNTKLENPFILKTIPPYAWAIFIFSLLTGCHQQETTINGRAKGIKNAVIEISGHGKLWDANIVDEKFQISVILDRAEFFKLKILFSGGKNKTVEYPIYLAEGEYNFVLDSASIQRYPLVKTQVKFQNELSYFYLSDLPDLSNLENFVRKHSKSPVSGYLLNQVSEKDMRENPGYYDKLFRLLDPEVTETAYSENAKNKIEGYTRIRPGVPMPKIEGRMPDGKPFNRNLLKGKLTLLTFWASWNYPSLNDIPHLKFLYDKNHTNGFEILGIAIDKKEERWKKAIAANGLSWLHVADFKGAYSKNFENFYTNKLPCYIIIGPDLKIVDFDVPVESVNIYINDFLKQASIE